MLDPGKRRNRRSPGTQVSDLPTNRDLSQHFFVMQG
jgi:hypothetical protein